ncbi:MAG: glycoside hydrolase family 30 beta sandwich domain-containing protein [Gammaproteobacteria bacterium]
MMDQRRVMRIFSGFVFIMMVVFSISTQAQTVNIDVAASQQTIDGFGFSTAWCPAITSAQGAVLFGTNSGQLGFSLLRVRIDPNENWGHEPANALTAHSYGATVLGTPWTPPASEKTNNSPICGDLLPSQYGNYAAHLNRAVQAINLDYVSFQNEPDWCPNPGYESSNPTPSEILTWVTNNAPSVGKPIVISESFNFKDSYTDPVLNDSVAVNNVTYIGGHLYGSGANIVHQNALNHGKHVWSTEHYINGADINTAMKVAKEISDAMNNQFSAYFWWWIMPNDPASFLQGTTVDLRGYVLGQFAHWVRPGMVHVNATYNPQSNVYVTAFYNNSNNGLVIIALNTSTTVVNQTFAIQNASNISTLTPFQTSSGINMAQLSAVALQNNTFNYSLPAQSITTFAQYP